MHSSAFLSELATFASAKTVWNNTASTKCQVQAAEKCFNLSLKLPQSIALQRDALEPVDPANARTAEFRPSDKRRRSKSAQPPPGKHRKYARRNCRARPPRPVRAAARRGGYALPQIGRASCRERV